MSRRVTTTVLSLALSLPALSNAGSAGPTPHEAYMRYSVGRLLEVQGLLADALVQYRLVQSMDPGRCGPATAVARVLLALDRPEDAREAIVGARALCPDDSDVLAVHADVLLALGDDAGAESLLAEPARADSSPPELLAALSEALVAQGRAEEAAALYAERCLADSLSPVLAFLHARVLIECGRNDEAVRELERAERLDPDNRAVTATLGRILVNLGRPGEAVPRLERVVAQGGSEQEYAALARAYGELGLHARAVALLRGAVESGGESPELLAVLGVAQYEAGDAEGAVSTYERLLETDPDSVLALNFVAYTLAELGRNLEHALAYAERAAELDPDSANVRDTLGWVHYRLGHYDAARRELEDAIRLGATQAVVHEHLGDALAALGLLDGARESWRRALEAEPGRPSAAERLQAHPETNGEAP